jgi:hypothetical protein
MFKKDDLVWYLSGNIIVAEAKIIKAIFFIQTNPVQYEIEIKCPDDHHFTRKAYHFDLYKRPKEREYLVSKLEANLEEVKLQIRKVKNNE